MKHFALIGAAGYIAPRHMKAIQETGNHLVAAYDPNDSVGIIDSYFPEADFFTEFERFDRHIEKLRRSGTKVDYVSICSPNYLHDAHIRFALRNGAHAICEKPIVLNPWNIDLLSELEAESSHRVYTILQLRLHPAIIALKKKYEHYQGPALDVDLEYVTSRGRWYDHSWKGDVSKSGGIATNIGIHFFDMLAWIFGDPDPNAPMGGVEVEVNTMSDHTASGTLSFAKAKVKWMLSIDAAMVPEQAKAKGQRTWRRILVDGQEIEFSEGFTDLHSASYRDILEGRGFGLADAKRSVEIAAKIREGGRLKS
jgi:UDP-N-acetyl-2-amino-2-deoxyglucuronate dehydrogenase